MSDEDHAYNLFLQKAWLRNGTDIIAVQTGPDRFRTFDEDAQAAARRLGRRVLIINRQRTLDFCDQELAALRDGGAAVEILADEKH